MTEYIEREAIIEDFKNDLMCMKASVFQGTPMSEINIDNVIERIREFPTADVAPVKHGKWRISKNEVLPTNRFVCSECNGLVIVSTYRNRCLYNYCPNCGAKMEGEQHGT